MTTPTPTSELAVMLSVMDRLTPAEAPEPASPAQLAARIQHACALEGVTLDPQQVQVEVEKALTQPMAPTAFDFGWDRPVTAQEAQARNDDLDRRERQFRWQLSGCLVGCFGIAPLFGYALAALSGHDLPGVLAGFFGGLGIAIWGVTKETGLTNAQARHHRLIPVAPHVSDVKRWQATPASMRYLRACLLSGVPLLAHDRDRLEALARQDEQANGQNYLESLKESLGTP